MLKLQQKIYLILYFQYKKKGLSLSLFFLYLRYFPLFDIDSNHYITRYQTASYGVKNIKCGLLNGHWITFKINKTESDTESKTLRVKKYIQPCGTLPMGLYIFLFQITWNDSIYFLSHFFLLVSIKYSPIFSINYFRLHGIWNS